MCGGSAADELGKRLAVGEVNPFLAAVPDPIAHVTGT